MENRAAVIAYWRDCLQQERLHNLELIDVYAHWNKITAAECNSGQLTQPVLISKLHNVGTIAVIPQYAQHDDAYFFPYMLLVEIDATGRFVAKQHLSLPIVPKTVLEGAALQPLVLTAAENIATYFAVNQPEWLEDANLLTWSAQLTYARELLAQTNQDWQEELTQHGYVLQNEAIVFAVAAALPITIEDPIDILEQEERLEVIDAKRNSCKSTYIKKLIVDAWIKAAVQQNSPPQHVWLEPYKDVMYADIFACLGLNLATALANVSLQDLLTKYDNYHSGRQILTNWRNVSNRLQEAYVDKGGVQARLAQLHSSLRDTKAQRRHLEVLYSIWLRQQELLPGWAKIFDVIPWFKCWRLQRLYSFFRQNFNDHTVLGLGQKQLQDLMQEKIRKVEYILRFQEDILYQVESHITQEQLVRDKCVQWCNEQQIATNNLAEIAANLETKLWQDLAMAAAAYWQQQLLSNPEYQRLLNTPPQQIDLLIVEHAQYISPMQASTLLAKAKKVLALGNYNAICNPRFALQIDYELTRQHALVDCDADFEDLQFDGVLGSVGNMWNLVTQGREADQVFEQTFKTALGYSYIDVRSQTSAYKGSKVNIGAVDAVVAWLRINDVARHEVAIYTCFSGQAQLLASATGLPVYLLHEPCFIKVKIALFVPVYTAQDQAPYSFDRGDEMLEQLQDNTLEQLIVIGDIRIFKPDLHSASGKFAKLLLKKLEVECV